MRISMKLFSVVLIGMMLIFGGLVTARGAAESAEAELVTPERIGRADAPNTLTYRAPAASSGQHANEDFRAMFRDRFVEWAEANPDWKIEITTVSSNHGVEQARLLEMAMAGQAPDIAAVDSFQLPLFINQGVLSPVTDHFADKEVADLFPFIRDGITGPDGELYAWWFNTDHRLLYRDTRYMPEAPKTWDEWIQYSLEAVNEYGAETGMLYNGGRHEGTIIDNLAHFWAQGGRLLDDNGAPIFHEEPNRQYVLNMLNFLKETVESEAAPRRVINIGHYNDMTSEALLGGVASIMGVHYQYFQLEAGLDPSEFHWEVSKIPGPPAGGNATGTGGWTIAAFTDDPEKIRVGMDFVRSVFIGPEQDITGNLPTQQKLFQEMEKFSHPVYEEYMKILEDGRARPGFPIYPELSNQFQIMIGDVLTGVSSPEEALQEATDNILAEYRDMK